MMRPVLYPGGQTETADHYTDYFIWVVYWIKVIHLYKIFETAVHCFSFQTCRLLNITGSSGETLEKS